MRPINPRGPAGGGMPTGPAVNRLPTKPTGGPPMPGPIVSRPPRMPGMKKGGSASSRADGCAVRGKTKGKIV